MCGYFLVPIPSVRLDVGLESVREHSGTKPLSLGLPLEHWDDLLEVNVEVLAEAIQVADIAALNTLDTECAIRLSLRLGRIMYTPAETQLFGPESVIADYEWRGGWVASVIMSALGGRQRW